VTESSLKRAGRDADSDPAHAGWLDIDGGDPRCRISPTARRRHDCFFG
jgi:hypothetical protein